jgi:hypothetical protein
MLRPGRPAGLGEVDEDETFLAAVESEMTGAALGWLPT